MKTAIVLAGSGVNAALHASILVAFVKSLGWDMENCELILFDSAVDMQKLSVVDCPHITACTAPAFGEECFSADGAITRLCELQSERSYDLFLFYESSIGNELCTRTAFRMDGSCLLGVRNVIAAESGCAAEKGVYSQNLTATFKLKKKPYLFTVQKNLCDPDTQPPKLAAQTQILQAELPPAGWMQDITVSRSEQGDRYRDADIVVVGGRGVGGKAGMILLQQLAGLLGGVLGGSRPTVMDGWLGQNRIIGMSGHVVHPRLCLVLGASGMMPLVKGVEKSKTLISVNLDRDAMIFKVSDVGVQADVTAIAEALIEKLGEKGIDRDDA